MWNNTVVFLSCYLQRIIQIINSRHITTAVGRCQKIDNWLNENKDEFTIPVSLYNSKKDTFHCRGYFLYISWMKKEAKRTILYVFKTSTPCRGVIIFSILHWWEAFLSFWKVWTQICMTFIVALRQHRDIGWCSSNLWMGSRNSFHKN